MNDGVIVIAQAQTDTMAHALMALFFTAAAV